MKTALKKGGQESLNMYVNAAAGYLSYAYYPSAEDFVLDGVAILNDSMPGGDAVGYNEGDILMHKVGHWLELDHTHGKAGGLGYNEGDILMHKVGHTEKLVALAVRGQVTIWILHRQVQAMQVQNQVKRT